MTTPQAAALYEAQHNIEMQNHKPVIYNPHNKPVDELPYIFGFNNGGSPGMLKAVAIAEDGIVLGTHCCSSVSYMEHDLGILEDTHPERHTNDYQKHYPHGYKMAFVSHDDERLLAALKRQKELT